MTDERRETDLPTLKTRLRELLAAAHSLPWLYRGKSGSIHTAPPEPPYQYGPGFLQLCDYDEADIDLIVEGINALPTLLDELDRLVVPVRAFRGPGEDEAGPVPFAGSER